MNLGKYLDWKFRGTTWLTLLVALVCLVCAFMLPETYGLKNSPVENVQMLVLAAGLIVTCTAKSCKRMFVFVSLCLFLILAREVNFGRTLFIFANPDDLKSFPRWKDFEYGWLAHVCVGIYMVWMLVYFIWRKVWKEIGEVLRTTRIPALDVLLSIAGLLIGVCFEMSHNNLSEELGELVMYAGGVGILYLYSRSRLSRR